MVKPAGPILQATTIANDDLVKFREGGSKVQQLRNLVKMADSKEITDPTLRTAVKAAKIELGMEKVSNLPSRKTVGIGVAVVAIAAAAATEYQTGFFSAIFKQLAASFMNFFSGNAEQTLPTQAPAAPLQGPRNFPESSPMQSLKKQILQAEAVSPTPLSTVLPKVTSTPNKLPKVEQVLSFAQQEQCSPFEEPAATPEPRSPWNDRTLSFAQQEQCSPFEARIKGFTNLSFSELRNNQTQPEYAFSEKPQPEPLGVTPWEFLERLNWKPGKATPSPQAAPAQGPMPSGKLDERPIMDQPQPCPLENLESLLTRKENYGIAGAFDLVKATQGDKARGISCENFLPWENRFILGSDGDIHGVEPEDLNHGPVQWGLQDSSNRPFIALRYSCGGPKKGVLTLFPPGHPGTPEQAVWGFSKVLTSGGVSWGSDEKGSPCPLREVDPRRTYPAGFIERFTQLLKNGQIFTNSHPGNVVNGLPASETVTLKLS